MHEDIVTEVIRQVMAERGVKLADNKVHNHQGEHHCNGNCGHHKQMTLELAMKLMERVEAKAKELDMRIVTAVSDGAGRPVAVHCMDGAYIGSFDVAVNKTYTAVAFQMSTAKLGELAAPGQSLYGIQFTNEGKIVIFGGGEPLYHGDRMIGAVGISGGSAEQDTYLAQYAVEQWNNLIK